MNEELLKVSLRQRALYLPGARMEKESNARTLALVVELRQLGFCFSEPLLHAVNGLTEAGQQTLLDVVNDVMGTRLNWASLVRGWLVPTGETVWDHFVTLMANMLKDQMDVDGVTLPCGHLIPDGTFPLERYNGCPFCGTPFHTATGQVCQGQASKLKLLQLWGDSELDAFFADLLYSPTPLDATQRESLKTLLRLRPLPATDGITMKETRMLVVDALVEQGHDNEAGRLFSSPADVLRYLWHKHTGQVQLLQPRTLLHIAEKNLRSKREQPNTTALLAEEKEKLKLKYTRSWCRRVARWLCILPMSTEQQCEAMHPQREMWVRMIRALRLAEYARKPEFGRLAELLDRFYRKDYDVFKGRLDHARLNNDASATLTLLKQRPGLFARSLFSTMLWFGPQAVIAAFREVLPQVAPRLLLTLGGQAELYFDRQQQRVVRPLSGVIQTTSAPPLLVHYSDEELTAMKQTVNQLYLDAMRERFNEQCSARPKGTLSKRSGERMYIDPQLYNIPVAVGDRSATIQDVSAALQGTRFPVEGDAVRLFMQWGKDLPAQHLDMDLSCYVLTDTSSYMCSYFNLSPAGCRHSGDIQHIPDLVGTAEYIELSFPELLAAGARRVVFTCNAYSDGALQPNLMVGWMSAEHPMAVSDSTGVAYDPSTVQHMVRISEPNLSKGLIFGVLDVAEREITWLEMPFDGQTVLSISPQTVDTFLRRLRAKPTIGQVLSIKAEAQHFGLVDSADQADEAYTLLWAQNSAQVSRLLL